MKGATIIQQEVPTAHNDDRTLLGLVNGVSARSISKAKRVAREQYCGDSPQGTVTLTNWHDTLGGAIAYICIDGVPTTMRVNIYTMTFFD